MPLPDSWPTRMRQLPGPPPLPIKAILPGLIFIGFINYSTVLGWRRMSLGPLDASLWILALLPWATLLVLRRSPACFGYVRRRALAEYGWGILAGTVWRGLSMAFNHWYFLQVQLGLDARNFLSAVILVPLTEETFYRGYLGRSLAARLGMWPAIMLQATAFALHPVHWHQGWPALLSILGFGILAGWLVLARGTLWIAWGAHGFAILLPELLLLLA